MITNKKKRDLTTILKSNSMLTLLNYYEADIFEHDSFHWRAIGGSKLTFIFLFVTKYDC